MSFIRAYYRDPKDSTEGGSVLVHSWHETKYVQTYIENNGMQFDGWGESISEETMPDADCAMCEGVVS